MADHTGDIRQFYYLNEAWYFLPQKDCTAEVMFGFYSPDGGTSGEMAMRWHNIGGSPTPRLEVFSDAWSALGRFGDVVTALAQVDGRDITPHEFCALLTRCGFQDRTERRQPNNPPAGIGVTRYLLTEAIKGAPDEAIPRLAEVLREAGLAAD